jgi:hypothetical protein
MREWREEATKKGREALRLEVREVSEWVSKLRALVREG